jgi:hypothetical protein
MAASGSSQEAIRVASGLAYVCRHLDELRELLGDDGSDPLMPLSRLVTDLHGGGASLDSQTGAQQPGERTVVFDVVGLLNEVHAAVQAAGDALGVYGFGPSRGGGLSGMEVLQFVFRCPLDRCVGRPAYEVRGAHPVCTVSAARLPLIRERL